MRTALFAFALTAALGISTARAETVSIGQPAPGFTLKDTAGVDHDLASSRGKLVVLEWTNPDCPFVKKHYESNNMQELQKYAATAGVVWYSICSSSSGKQGSYSAEEWDKIQANRHAQCKALLLDRDGTVGKLYGAKTTPHMYVIDPEGKLIYQGAIDDTPSTDADDIPKSHNYVKAALDEALAGKPVGTPTTKPYGCGVKYGDQVTRATR